MLKVFLYIKGSIDIKQFMYVNRERDIYYAFSAAEIRLNLYKKYDLYVLSCKDVEDFNKNLEHITKYIDNDILIYTRKEDIQFDDEKSYFVLTVKTGDYDYVYNKIIGIFNSRIKAYEYYVKHCRIDWSDIEKNNKLYDEYEKNEPCEDDYNDSEGNVDWQQYETDCKKYWSDKGTNTRLSEDDITSYCIEKVKIID